MTAKVDRPAATKVEIKRARMRYETEDVQIDDDARVSRGDDGTWVQAWVLLPNTLGRRRTHPSAPPEEILPDPFPLSR